MDNNIRRTMVLVRFLYRGLVDKSGVPAIQHPTTVAQLSEVRASRLGWSDEDINNAFIVGYLHDAVEDGLITLEELSKMGYSDVIIEALDAITRREKELYHNQYIRRVMANRIASLVKFQDLCTNIARTPRGANNLKQRYEKAQNMLRGGAYCVE